VDLLEGRYNIATRGIPAAAVKDIEVLQRHNHARIDIGKTDSDDVAINLNIKDDQSLVFGSSKADAGLPLVTASGEATPIYLNDKLQNIASLRANNMGISLQNYGEELTAGNRDISRLKLQNTTSIQPPQVTGNTISNRYRLDNNSIAITNNALGTFKKELLVKGAVDYNYEDSSISTNNQRIFFSGADSTLVNSSSENSLIQRRYGATNTIEVNTDKLYVKNKIQGSFLNQDGGSENVLNGEQINAAFKNTLRSLTNILELKTTINDMIVNSGLLLEYNAANESLQVNPAVFSGIIPSGINDATVQDVTLEKMNVAAFTGYTFNLLQLEWEAKQHVRWSSERSNTLLNQQGSALLNTPFATDFQLHTFESRTRLFSTFMWNQFKFNVVPEITYFDINRSETIGDTGSNDNYLFSNFSAQVARKFGTKWAFSADASIRNDISRFNDLYPGLVLTQFNNLNTNPQDINISRTQQASLSVDYSDILAGYFLKNNTTYSSTASEFIFSRTLDQNGLINVNTIRQDNTFNNFKNTTTLITSLLKNLATQVSYNFELTTLEQFFNGVAQDNNLFNHTIDTELIWNTGSWYGITYKGMVHFGISRVDSFRATNTFQLHNLELDLYLSEKARWNFNTETAISSLSSSNNASINSLFNTSFYYKPSKKMILRAELFNIFNERFFTVASSNTNFISQSQFSLRPLQFTVGLNYTL